MHGDITSFNINNGFAEALVRGLRSGFVGDSEYSHLTQCDKLEDMKVNLKETDYEDFMINDPVLNPALLRDRATAKLVNEFRYMRMHATGMQGQFLDFIVHEYMIYNVLTLLRGTKSGTRFEDLIKICHPLGMFRESTMRQIIAYEPNAKDYGELYETVLVETPIGCYFSRYLDEFRDRELVGGVRSSTYPTGGESNANADEGDLSDTGMSNLLRQVSLDILENALMKIYLEEFYSFCMTCGDETAEVMGHLLQTRADRLAINVTLNSFGTPLNEADMRDDERFHLCPSFGYLYPAVTMNFRSVTDEYQLLAALQGFPLYYGIFQRGTQSRDMTVDDAFLEHDVRFLELAFENQMQFGVFYAYIKLKEQEVRNLVYISECILQRRRDKINNFIRLFSEDSWWRRGGAANR